MNKRILRGVTAAFTAALVLIGPAVAGSVGSTASARGVCWVYRHHHFEHCR